MRISALVLGLQTGTVAVCQFMRGVITYLSLNAVAPAFLDVTEMTASSKLHDDAALTTLAPSSRAEGSNECRNFMVGDGVL